ncbi:MAG: FadR family transcriptional regulator [Actinobacteria bacterium]|nr:FadR family transcriptional regulator [Actinomycetota bacterium]
MIALDRELHRQIWAMTGNGMLEQTLEWLFSHVLRRWNVLLDRSEALGDVMAQHEAVVDAIVAGDADLARAAMARHVADYQRSLAS